MIGVKGRFLKKLKSIPRQLPHHRFSLSNPSPIPLHHSSDHSHQHITDDHPSSPPQSHTATAAAASTISDKEKVDPQPQTPTITPTKRDRDTNSPSNLDVSTFRRPRLNSTTLFDPHLLEAFNLAVADFHRTRAASIELSRAPYDPLSRFEDRCPPGGRETIVVYTTSLRGIRKTFEDCNRVKHLLSSLKVHFYERDVAVDVGLREELWKILGGRPIPPRIFVKGRYIGGAEEMVELHEMGELLPILEGVRIKEEEVCGDCGGMLFLVCEECGGGRKLYLEEEEKMVRCGKCNENGLVACSWCCG